MMSIYWDKRTYCKENAEALVTATKEIGLEVIAGKSKCMVMSRDQNAGHSHSIKIAYVWE